MIKNELQELGGSEERQEDSKFVVSMWWLSDGVSVDKAIIRNFFFPGENSATAFFIRHSNMEDKADIMDIDRFDELAKRSENFLCNEPEIYTSYDCQDGYDDFYRDHKEGLE